MDVAYTSRNNSASTVNQAFEEKVQACPTRSSAVLNLIESAKQNPRVVNEFYRMQSSDCTSNLLNTVALSCLPEDLMNANLSTEGQAARNLLGILVHHVDAADKKIFLKACDYLLRTSNPKIKSTERHSLENKTAGLLKTLISKHGRDAFNIFYLNFVQHCREAWAKHHNVSLEGVRDEDIFTASYNSCADVFTGQIEQLNLPDANWTSLTQFNDFIMDTLSAIPKTLKFKEDSDDKKPEEVPPAKSPVNNLAGPANSGPAIPAAATPDTARDRAINIHVEGSKAEARIGDGSAAAPAASGGEDWKFATKLLDAPINEKSKVDLLQQFMELKRLSRPSGVLARIESVTPFNGRVDGNSSEPDGVPKEYSSEPDGAPSVDQHGGSAFTERNTEGELLIPTETVASSQQRAESDGSSAAEMQSESVITQRNVSGDQLTASEVVVPSLQRAVSDVNFASQEAIRWLQAAESNGALAAGVQSESVVTEQNTSANFYTAAKDLSRSLSETLGVALENQQLNLQPEVRLVTEDSVGNLVSEPLLSQSALSEDVQHPPKQTAQMLASYDEVDSVAPAAYELIKQQQHTADFSAFNQPVSKNASTGFISSNDASTRRIDPQTLAKAEDLANWIATRGNWSGNAGDIAPNLIANVFPNIMLRINVFNINKPRINPVTTGFDHTETKRLVELNLRNDHYTPVIYGREKEAPADGDCFYYSLSYVLNGVKPSGDEIQQLRNKIAGYVRQNPEKIVPFISDDLHNEIKQQRPFALTDGSSTTVVDTVDVHPQESENVTPVVKNIPEPPKPVIEHDIHTKSAPPVDNKPTPRLNGEGQTEERQPLAKGGPVSAHEGKNNLLNEIQQEIARRNAAKSQPSAENGATPRLNGDRQAEERQPLTTGATDSSFEGESSLAAEIRQAVERRNAAKSQPSAENEATPRLNGEGQTEERQPLTTGATDSSVGGESNLAAEIRQAVERRNAAKSQPSAENEATPRLNGEGQTEERQPLTTGATDSSVGGESNLAAEIRQAVERRNAAKRQPSAENEPTTRLNGEGQTEERQPVAKGGPVSAPEGKNNLLNEIQQEIARRNAAKRQPSAENEAPPRLNGDGQTEERQPSLKPSGSSVAEKIALFTEQQEATRKGAANQSVKPSAQQETSRLTDELPADPINIDAGLSANVVGNQPANEDLAISTNPSSKAVDSSGQRIYTTWNTVDVFNRRNSIDRGAYVKKHTDAKAAELESNELQQAFVALAKKPDSGSDFADRISAEDRTAESTWFQGLRAR